MTARADAWPQSLPLLVALLVALTAVRIIGLYFSAADLFFDEAQYWDWSRELAFGYFSKPPGLAWTIRAATEVCGHSEVCIRAPAALIHLGTTIVTYFIALRLYGARVAFWSALCLALGPGTIFSSRIISTDVPLLFFWALALLAFVRLIDTQEGRSAWRWSVTLGVALGLGLLSKYAMAYFFLGVALAALVDERVRLLMRRPSWWVAVALALVLLAPNIAWNAANDFATLRHTGDNIEGSGLRFSILGALEFVAAQFGVMGPIMFAVFLVLLVRPSWIVFEKADRLMIAFALPPLVLVTIVGFATKAFANWAAPSIISLTIVAVAMLVRRMEFRWLYATVIIGVVVQAVLPVADANAERVSLPFLKSPDIYARTVGWRALSEVIGARAKENGARVIAAEQRDTIAALVYYLRETSFEVVSWPSTTLRDHHFNLSRPLRANAPEPILFVTYCGLPGRLEAQFSRVEPLPAAEAPAGPHTRRGSLLFRLSGSKGNVAPLGPCV
jgi:4-amino-4-deoxy-L-arabinose transferase-like glycosyltransferase